MIEIKNVIIGAGPAGYELALGLGERGEEVLIVDRRGFAGGTCLFEGCIPSKAILSVLRTKKKILDLNKRGIELSSIEVKTEFLRKKVEKTIKVLSRGIHVGFEKNSIEFMKKEASFIDADTILLRDSNSEYELKFKRCIIATGSVTAIPAPLKIDGVWTSREALLLEKIPKKLLVIGAGVIGLELATIYGLIGSEVFIVELLDKVLMPMHDLLRPYLVRGLKKYIKKISTSTLVKAIENRGDIFYVRFKNEKGEWEDEFDQIIVATGRVPNTNIKGLRDAGVEVDKRGFIKVNERYETSQNKIYAIGDVIYGPMLAHRAYSDARNLLNIFCNEDVNSKTNLIPYVVFTEPQVGWVGDEDRVKSYLSAELLSLGIARAEDETNGVLKLGVDNENRVVWSGYVGPHAAEIISMCMIMIERGMKLKELHNLVFPHPTFPEIFHSIK